MASDIQLFLLHCCIKKFMRMIDLAGAGDFFRREFGKIACRGILARLTRMQYPRNNRRNRRRIETELKRDLRRRPVASLIEKFEHTRRRSPSAKLALRPGRTV